MKHDPEVTNRPEPLGRRLRRALLAAMPTLALFACGGDGGQVGDAVVRDSAGVRIVEHARAPDAESRFAFAPEPLYRHGNDPGEHMFGRAWTGVLLADGSAVVSDAASSEVVRLDSDGAFHSVVAGPGEGPGEVTMVTSMFRAGRDSVLVLDIVQTRSTLFADGALARTASVLDLRRLTSLWPKGIDDAGGFLVATNSYRSGFEEQWLFGHMARYDPGTGAVDTVASYEYVPAESNPAPGTGSVFVSGGEFVYLRSDRSEVVWHLADGTVRQIVRWPLEPRFLSEEHLAVIEPILRERLRFANRGVSEAELDEWIREDMADYEADLGSPIAHFRSPFADAEGRVWLPTSLPGPTDGAPPYTVVSRDGESLEMVDGPPGLRILDVGWGRVLGVVRDELGVESVVVYGLVGGG